MDQRCLKVVPKLSQSCPQVVLRLPKRCLYVVPKLSLTKVTVTLDKLRPHGPKLSSRCLQVASKLCQSRPQVVSKSQ